MRKGRFLLAGVIVLAVVLSVGLAYVTQLYYEKRDSLHHNEWLRSLSLEVKSEIRVHTDSLYAFKNLIEAADGFSPESFQLFALSSFLRYSGLQSFRWALKQEDPALPSGIYVRQEVGAITQTWLDQNIADNPDIENLIIRAEKSQRLTLWPSNEPGHFIAALGVFHKDQQSQIANVGYLIAHFDFSPIFKRYLSINEIGAQSILLRDITIEDQPVDLLKEGRSLDSGHAFQTIFSVAGRVFELRAHIGYGSFSLISVLVGAMAAFIIVLLALYRSKKYQSDEEVNRKISQQVDHLREEKILHQIFQSSTTEGFLALDCEGMVLKTNLRADSIFACPTPGCRKKHISDFLSEKSQDLLFEKEAGTNNIRPKRFNEEITVEGVDTRAHRFPIEVYFAELQEMDTWRWLVIVRDLRENYRKAAQASMSGELYREAFVMGSSPVLIMDVKGVVQESNRAIQRLLAFYEQDLAGRRFLDFLHPEGLFEFKMWLKCAENRTKEYFEKEQKLLSRDGKTTAVKATYTALYDEDGACKNIIAQYVDISEGRRTELELKDHRDRLQDLIDTRTREVEDTKERLVVAIEAVPDGILALDMNNNVEFYNDQFLDVFPEMRGTIKIGQSVAELIKIAAQRTDEDQAAQDARLKRVSEGMSGDETYLNDGRWIVTRRRKIPSGGTVIVHSNVTAYKEQEAKLRKQAQILQEGLANQKELNEQQHVFVSMVSHEFRTPLSIIDSTAQRLLRHSGSWDEDEVRQRIQKIRSAVNRLLNLVQGTLSLEKTAQGETRYNPQELDICAFLTEIGETHQEIMKHHTIDVSVPAPALMVMFDPNILQAILSNLLSNAEKFSAPNTCINLSLERRDAGVEIAVCDKGEGISELDQQKILNLYYRSPNTHDVEGSGLGLSIVSELCRLHEAELQVSSELGVGSCFKIILKN